MEPEVETKDISNEENGEKKMKVDPWTAKHVNYDKLVEVCQRIILFAIL
jgi:hypothetical protein